MSKKFNVFIDLQSYCKLKGNIVALILFASVIFLHYQLNTEIQAKIISYSARKPSKECN